MMVLAFAMACVVLTGCGVPAGGNSDDTTSDGTTSDGADSTTTQAVVTDYNDLIGKVVCSIGETNVPSQVFRAILDKEGIPYEESDKAIDGKVAITYTSSLTGTAAILSNGGVDYVISAEPSVSAVLATDDKFFVANDLQQTYSDSFETDYGFPQAVLVAKDGYVESNPDEVYAVMQSIKGADAYLESNLETAKSNFEDAGSIALLSVTQSAIENSNLAFGLKDTQAEAISTFLSTFTSGYTGEIPASTNTDFYVDTPTSGSTPTSTVKIYSPDGAPSLALGALLGEDYADINIMTDSTLLPATLSPAGDANMAIVPSNMAVTVFNNFGAEFIATITYGNLYMVGMSA